MRVATSVNLKQLPTMESLISKGILPDIFSPSKPSDGSEGDVTLSIRESRVHRKYLSKNKVALGDKSPMDSVREMEERWRAKATIKKDTSASSASFSRKQKEGMDDLGTQVALATRKKKALENATSSLLSLFERQVEGREDSTAGDGLAEVDSDPAGAQQLKMEMRRKRRERRKYAELQKQASLKLAAGGGDQLASHLSVDLDAKDTSDLDEPYDEESFNEPPLSGKASPVGMPLLDMTAVRSPKAGMPPALPKV